MLILVVEDDEDIADFLREFLTTNGYAVEVATNGQQALAHLQHTRPAAILSDIMMPVMDGLELCHQLAQDDHYRTIPIIMMSAGKTAPQDDGCPYAAFIPKPFLVLELATMLEHLIETT